MRTPAAALLLLAAACGDAASKHASADPASAAPHVIRPPAESTALAATAPDPTSDVPSGGAGLSTAVGALERPAALRHLFEGLARLDEGKAHDDVRVVQFGDSHTAADYETGPMRRALQARFGDGGRGFLPLGRPWPFYVQEGLVNLGMAGWKPQRGTVLAKGFAGDGMYGLTGIAIETSKGGSRTWTEISARATKVELAYLAQPRGGSVDVIIDGARAGRVSTKADAPVSQFRMFEASDKPHQIELSAVGDGDVRVFGVLLDRPQVGLTLDALGINGAKVATALQWSEPHMAEQLKHRAPDLVVLAYGTNEATDDTPLPVFERQLVDELGRVARAVPSASCMLLGPPDRATRATGLWMTVPRLLDIIATERRVAEAAGCAFYNQLEGMGGTGMMAVWAAEPQPRALPDRVHFTRDGYAQLGNSVASDLIRAYTAWRAETGLPPVTPTPPAAPSTTPPPAAAQSHDTVAVGAVGR